MKTINLSKRLKTVASYLPKDVCFADIGTDHAYLPCYICLNDPKARAVAGEVNKGPFNSALKTVYKHQLQHVIDVRLGDGLHVLTNNDEVSHVVIAGMGGALMRQILDEGKSQLATVKRIIAQPHTDESDVRYWFMNHHYSIVSETMVEENGRIYEIIVADYKKENLPNEQLTEKELLFGPLLMKNKSKLFYKKWLREKRKLINILTQMKQANVEPKQVKRLSLKLRWIKEVLGDE